MTIAILSDIHGNLPALEAVVTHAEAQGCTRFLNLGDSLSGPLWPSETADYLMTRGWETIAGNHERQLLTVEAGRMNASDAFAHARLAQAHLDWMASLPETLALAGTFLCHGTPRSDIEHFLETIEPSGLRDATDAELSERLGMHADALTLCGHSHRPGRRELADGRAVANPGSVGLQAFHDDRPYRYTVANGDPRARYAVLHGDTLTFHAADYDHRAAAAKAAGEGRRDWAHALATGQAEP
jgi:diadenosine tetraphosphatase ApaH/serine/threonine PP2A family protein phosphatase